MSYHHVGSLARAWQKEIADPVFLSTTTNTLDAKGRVSVPAPFRARVAKDGFETVVIWMSLNGDYLEGATLSYLERLQDSLDQMDPFDETREAMEQAIFGGSVELGFDSGGRISLPATLIDAAGLAKKATFVGVGRTFQIWNPDAHAAHLETARATALANRSQVPTPTPKART